MDIKMLGERIKKIRESKSLTQNQLSKICGLRTATISDIENGKCNFEFKTLTAISEALNCEVNIVFIVKGS